MNYSEQTQNKLEQIVALRRWLKSKWNISLEEFDDLLQQHYSMTLKQLLDKWEANPYLPLVNVVITEGYEDEILYK